jgi:hypothetical protein
MKQAAANPTTHSTRDTDVQVLGTLGKDLLDTAWRMTLPVVLFVVPGIILDKKLGTAPWFTLAFTAAGFVLAALLVKRQMAAVEQRETKK